MNGKYHDLKRKQSDSLKASNQFGIENDNEADSKFEKLQEEMKKKDNLIRELQK